MEEISPIFFEQVLIKFLFTDTNVRDKVYPYLSLNVFDDKSNEQLVAKILRFEEKYEKFPTFKEMKLYLKTPDLFERLGEIINVDVTEFQHEFLIEQIEGWFKSKLVNNVNIEISELLSEDIDKIPDMVDKLREAAAFSFDDRIGLDFFEAEDELFHSLHNKDKVISSGLPTLDKIIAGGFHEKSLSLFMAECVDENTPINIRYRKKKKKWIYTEIDIKFLEDLIKNYEIQVTSPNGWVKVIDYVKKGSKEAWKLEINGRILFSSEYHVYMTNNGLKYVKEINPLIDTVLFEDGKFYSVFVRKMDFEINVVDITVDHPSHLYYTNGAVSKNTNLGKSLILCSLATNNVLQNKNVLYVTMEMSKEKISERIMANMFDVEMNDLGIIDKKKFHEYFEKYRKTLKSKLIIEEYPNATITANHIRNLLKQLKLKKNFVPDIIFLDYIENMKPIQSRKADSSYSEVKRISEEVRAIAVETTIPIVSAVQSNRDGFGAAELDLTNISQSIGTAATADVIIGITQPEEFRDNGMFRWMLLKNRYGINKQFMNVMVEYCKMRISEIENVNGSNISVDNKKKNSKKVDKNEVDKAADDLLEFMSNEIKIDINKFSGIE